MTKIVVVGGGLGGLAAALFSARRGHEVVLLERDEGPPEGTADDDFERWDRPGVPQARQSHNFLGLSCAVLSAEAPDVVEALLDRGAMRTDVSVAGRGADPDAGELSLLCRRLVYEAVVRRAVAREPGVAIRTGVAAVGLLTHRADHALPIAVGVRTDAGDDVEADLVVDSSGRRSPAAQWLEDGGAEVPSTRVQECGFHYHTRFYRLRDGRAFPDTAIPIITALDYATVMAFPGDNGTFSLSSSVSTEDPLRLKLRDPERFDRFLANVPVTAPWIDAGEPISDVNPMARIENRWRRLVDGDGRPIVGGLVLVGDSSLHTNPTFGRGVSLAFAQAQHLAATAEQVHADPVGYVHAFEDWTASHLGVWYESQVAADGAALERMTAGLRGEHLPPSENPISRFIAAMFALSATDQEVSRALARIAHLLLTPQELFADAPLVGRINAYVEAHPTPDDPPAGPSRREFEDLLA
jgi:2-polyprenyl-6-methoxyphenol hydroxylase-like FAD-dependent oxidoreductase